MLWIISSKYDITTVYVKKWLYSLGHKFNSVNTEDYSKLNYFHLSNENLKISVVDNKSFGKDCIIWHRRGRLRHIPKILGHSNHIYNYLKREEDALIKSIELILKNSVNYIGSFLKETENYKLENLFIAKSVGLKIPNTIVTTSKDDLIKFVSHFECVTKDIRYPVNFETEQSSYISKGTIQISLKDVESLAEDFAPILVQELIKKQFEIRIFFLDELFYAMAIFSQNDDKTKLDYRNYNYDKPNRCVPFELPKTVFTKLKLFLKKVNIRTGSIDLIVTTSGDYVFLEINPMGQLDWLSKSCNYYIEKEIAHYFSKLNNNYE